MSLIPLVKTAHAATLLQMIKNVNSDIYPLIEKAGLPENVLAGQFDYLPEKPVNHLLELIAQKAQPEIYGKLLRATIKERFLPKLLPQLDEPRDLGDAITQVLKIITADAPHSDYAIRQFRDAAWFCRVKKNKHTQGFMWAEIFAVLFIVELVNLLCQTQWLPKTIAVQSASAEQLAAIIGNNSTHFYTSRSMAAIQLDNALLTMPLALPKRRRATASPSPAPRNFVDTVCAALYPYLSCQMLTLEQAAELLELSPRTFQRRLAEENTNYKAIRENIMLTTACRLMENPNYSLTAIATQLGYANISHFSRAFKQLTGFPPKNYRKQFLCE